MSENGAGALHFGGVPTVEIRRADIAVGDADVLVAQLHWNAGRGLPVQARADQHLTFVNAEGLLERGGQGGNFDVRSSPRSR